MTSAARQYLDSHPWITFRFGLRALSGKDWMQIGEALSKCDHIAGVPLAPRVAAELHQIFLIKGVHATTQIEGNTLSEEEVGKRLKGNLPLPESQEYMGIEVENVAKGCELVMQELAGGAEIPLSPERIALFNKIVLDGLGLEEDVIPGATRPRQTATIYWDGSAAGLKSSAVPRRAVRLLCAERVRRGAARAAEYHSAAAAQRRVDQLRPRGAPSVQLTDDRPPAGAGALAPS
ncbi:MAG TPA: hypothetical protein VFM54_18480 [Micromonosporaceae bacterium]|nr:hypothetical protein [Micromonosporaceae bacterium]